jgi:hypothetical protein
MMDKSLCAKAQSDRDVILQNLVGTYEHLEQNSCLHLQSKRQRQQFLEDNRLTYQTIYGRIAEDHNV